MHGVVLIGKYQQTLITNYSYVIVLKMHLMRDAFYSEHKILLSRIF